MKVTKTTLIMALLLAGCISGAIAAPVQPNWQPQATEKLMRLPPSYLKKAVDRDFSSSELGMALSDAETDVRLKSQTLSDLRGAIEQSDGDLKTELRHQFLVEKREYINRMNERLGLQRKHLETRKSFYEKLLKKAELDKANQSPERDALIEKQEAARKRFESSLTDVDMKLFGSPEVEESRYAKDYAKNMAAIERLVAAIKAHPMNKQPEMDGEILSRQEYLRLMAAETESQLAILDQESTLLGYMAKLVALDALALSEEVDDAELIDSDIPENTDVASDVDIFITN
jgi:hypothetical protein